MVLAVISALTSFTCRADDGFVPIFVGKMVQGWHASAKTSGRWVVENGAITGSQEIPGNGGIFIIDPQKRHPDTSGIALHVHCGGHLTKQFVRYREHAGE